MVVSRNGVSTIANVRDRFALFREMAFRQTVRISIEVRVVVNKLTIIAQLINGCAAAVALKEFHDGTVCRGNYGSTPRSRYVNRVMNASFRTRFSEGIPQLLGPYAGNRNDQFPRRT